MLCDPQIGFCVSQSNTKNIALPIDQYYLLNLHHFIALTTAKSLEITPIGLLESQPQYMYFMQGSRKDSISRSRANLA